MSPFKMIVLLFSYVALLVFTACAKPLQNGANLNQVSALSCKAAPLLPTIVSGSPDAITVAVTGGTAPYSIPTQGSNVGVTSFKASTSIIRTYTNTASSTTPVSDSVQVTDASGAATLCSFSISFQSAPANGLACQLGINSDSSLVAGLNINFTFAATGGTAPYTFSNFSPGANSVASTSSGSAASATYTVGTTTALVQVTDSASNSNTCSEQLLIMNPAGNPGPYVVVSGSGLGSCLPNQCVWATGSGMSTNCTVNIYTPDWMPKDNNLIKTLSESEVSCKPTEVTFNIPSEILGKYKGMNFTVTNQQNGNWSPPQYIAFPTN